MKELSAEQKITLAQANFEHAESRRKLLEIARGETNSLTKLIIVQMLSLIPLVLGQTYTLFGLGRPPKFDYQGFFLMVFPFIFMIMTPLAFTLRKTMKRLDAVAKLLDRELSMKQSEFSKAD